MAALIAVILGWGVFGSAVASPRPYTVDDMLRLEEFGAVNFDKSGDALFFEYFGPYEEQADFGRTFVLGGTRSKIYWVDLNRSVSAKPLFQQSPSSGYTIDSVSPNGDLLLYDEVSRESGHQKGIIKIGRRQGRALSINADYSNVYDSQWVDRNHVAVAELHDGQTPLAVGLFAETRQKVVDDWTATRNGVATTASVIGAGRYANSKTRGERLALVDARSRAHKSIAAGYYRVIAPSPEGEVVAALQEKKLKIDPDQLINHGANIGGIERELFIFDRSGRNDPVNPCVNCDVLMSSLRWRPDGGALAFTARAPGDQWSEASIYVFDRATSKTRIVNLANKKLYTDYSGLALSIRLQWLGDSLAILVASSETAKAGMIEKPRGDWLLVSPDGLKNLTAKFEGDTPALVATDGKNLFLLHEGNLWSVTANGARRNLTEDLAGEVRGWSPPAMVGGVVRPVESSAEHIVLQVQSVDAELPNTIAIVDINTGEIQKVEAPSKNSASCRGFRRRCTRSIRRPK